MDLNVTFTLVAQIKSSPDILCSLLSYTHPQAIVRLPALLVVPFQAFANWNYLSLQITPHAQRPFALIRLCCPYSPRYYSLIRQSGSLSLISLSVMQRVLVIQGLS
jgi:hypothetical protein